MKRNIGFIAFMLSIFIILNIDFTNGLEKNTINFTNLNSNNFLDFLKETS